MNNSVETRKSKSGVRLILPHGASDDKVSMIHRNQISRELAREMILILELLPIDVRVRILRFLQCMGDGALHVKDNKHQ
ncbi:hypothetical protein C4D60_Mb06t11570 [Musa balbisiana]|uniref:Uncharacterized protein n=1 Tax=Musa balbisiana TaxID=52838 RepID=A0A4S8IMG9_MUSBA|nr:hypothetical protein C4D60_Mb06t11570 [Musa balbisiana]